MPTTDIVKRLRTQSFTGDLEAIRIAADLLEKLLASHRRLVAMMPLFEEARDAICAIPLERAKLRGIRLDLADRMDDVGIKERWEAKQAAEAALQEHNNAQQ